MDNPYGIARQIDPVRSEATAPDSTFSHTNTAPDPDYLPYVDHTTEADLVQAKIKDGLQASDFAPPSSAPAPEQPFIRDPVLARGAWILSREWLHCVGHTLDFGLTIAS